MYNRLSNYVRSTRIFTNNLSQSRFINQHLHRIHYFTTLKSTKQLVNLSDNAIKEIRRVTAEGQIVKLSLDVKGCNGYTYDMTLVNKCEIDHIDEIVLDESNNPLLIIDSKAIMYILGTKIDFEENSDGISSQFIFTNPNVGSCCGCGMSFNFRQ